MSPVNLSWQVILSDAAMYLNSQWKIKVADAYNRNLAGYYPFNSSGQDLPLQDFKDFFKPNGIYWSFFDSELSKFINKERLTVNKWEKEGIKFSDDFISS
jgi:type VI secretion system protein ImpL